MLKGLVDKIMRQDDSLFLEIQWRDFEANRLKSVEEEIDRWDENRQPNTSVDELCNDLVQKYRIDVPVLDRDNIRPTHREVQIDVSQDSLRGIRDRSKPFYETETETEIEITVPFTGEADIFKTLTPDNGFSMNPPRGNVKDGAITLSTIRRGREVDEVEREINERLDGIDSYLTKFHKGVDRLNKRLASLPRDYIEQRRQKLLDDREFVASLGNKLKQRDDSQK